MKSIGENIKDIRKQKGISQKELAKKLNISQSAVSQFEKNIAEPKMTTIKRIAEALDVPYFQLIDLKLNDGSFFSWDPALIDCDDELADDLNDYLENNLKERKLDGIVDKLTKIGWTMHPSIYINENSIEFKTDKNEIVILSDEDLLALDQETDEYLKFKVNIFLNK